jgi:hypothetical protein
VGDVTSNRYTRAVLAVTETTWAALGALATWATAVIAVVATFVYSRRQTDLALRAAENARVSAQAAVDAAQTAVQALRQDWATAGNSTATAWRAQVIGLFDRGLSAAEIRDIFETEGGITRNPATRRLNIEEEVAIKNGDIDAIVKVPEAHPPGSAT